ncbi:MAG: hypothetical protein OHK0048_25850 [Rhodoferax sp.]
MRKDVALAVSALWWGGLTAVGFGAVPLLFVHLPSPALAGQTAAHMFSALNAMAVVCAVVWLLLNRQNRPIAQSESAVATHFFVVGGMLLALVLEWGVAPRILVRQDLRLWHTVGSVLYAVQWLCAWVVLRRSARQWV